MDATSKNIAMIMAMWNTNCSASNDKLTQWKDSENIMSSLVNWYNPLMQSNVSGQSLLEDIMMPSIEIYDLVYCF